VIDPNPDVCERPTKTIATDAVTFQPPTFTVRRCRRGDRPAGLTQSIKDEQWSGCWTYTSRCPEHLFRLFQSENIGPPALAVP
jgi:hypothetical protein